MEAVPRAMSRPPSSCSAASYSQRLKRSFTVRASTSSSHQKAVMKDGGIPLLLQLARCYRESAQSETAKEEGRNQELSKTYVRYDVRQKRADAKSALKNLLFDGKPAHKVSKIRLKDRKLKTRHLNSIKEKCMKKRGRIDEGDKGNFTWTWAGETFTYPNSGPGGFEWRENSNCHQNQNKKFYNDSDIEDEGEERSNATDLMIHRATLGLPCTGPLILDHIKSAFRSTALKWHPDKYEGPSKRR